MLVNSYKVLLFALIVSLFLVYIPGLSGGFLLDDNGTLPLLAQWGSLNTIEKICEYVFGGITGPTGRPVALFSFILNAQTWPADPFPFLLTNIFIHILNTLLLFLVLLRVFQQANINEPNWLAFVATVLWALHVSQVSTVLYVVQRMAMLALSFNLLAILAYLEMREAWLSRRYKYSILILIVFGVCAVLGLCSKENAALLPLQLLLIEFLLSVVVIVRVKNRLKFFRWVFVYIPSLVVLLYLAKFLPGYRLTEVGGVRAFTPWERQLTEFRVLGDYIGMFFAPKTQSSGVFHDGYIISKQLLKPISTLYYLLFHMVCMVGALCLRKRWPLVFFGVYWFYLNHLVESSVIQLELKFEHRNYVPSIGLAVIIALIVKSLPITKKIRAGLVVVMCTLMALATYSRASLWGDPQQASLVWVQQNPSSVRAIEQAVLVHQLVPGHELLVDQLYEKGAVLSEYRPMITLKALNYRCQRLSKSDSQLIVNEIASQLKKSEVDWQIGRVFEEMLDSMVAGDCRSVTKEQYQLLIDAAINNDRYRRTQVPLQLRMLKILAELRLGDINKANQQYQSENYVVLPLSLVMKHALWLAVEGQQSIAAEILSRSILHSRQAEDFLKQQAQDMLQKIKNDIELTK